MSHCIRIGQKSLEEEDIRDVMVDIPQVCMSQRICSALLSVNGWSLTSQANVHVTPEMHLICVDSDIEHIKSI